MLVRFKDVVYSHLIAGNGGIPLRPWMFILVFVVCSVGSGLCDQLRSEKSHQVCVIEKRQPQGGLGPRLNVVLQKRNGRFWY